MEFFSPLSDIFAEKKDLDSIIRQAKGRQLDYSLKRIREFKFLDCVIEEAMPDDTPEVLIQKRRNIKYL